MNMIAALKKARRTFLYKQEDRRNHHTKYKVEGTIRGKKEMIFVLSGYKPYLWDDIFSRIKKNQPVTAEVCIVSSGKYVEELSQMCKENDWVYVSTELNNICVATNIVMRLFDKAEYIHKLDEDIYIPDGYFNDMKNAYEIIEKKEPCEIGYICPVLPLGFYGMHNFLVKFNVLEEYENKFGKHRLGGTVVNPIFRKGCGVDAFIWEKIGNFDDCVMGVQKGRFFLSCMCFSLGYSGHFV